MATIFAGRSMPEFIAQLRGFAEAQQEMAARAVEDRAHWHHVVLADLLTEAARRLETSVA